MTVALGNNIALPLSSALSYRLAFDTMGKLANYGKLGGTADPDAVIEALFASGEQGAWYDPSDLSTMFQDSAGTTPVTADGQPVGLIRDKSGNNNQIIKTLSNMLRLSRQEGTRELLRDQIFNLEGQVMVLEKIVNQTYENERDTYLLLVD